MRLLAPVLALAALIAAGCSPLALLNAAVPRGTYDRVEGIPYGDGPRRQLDVYVPDAKAFPGTRPVIVFFYGGAWEAGERGQHRFVGEAFASRGFVVVVPDYRLYPEVRYPEYVRDAAGAMAWTKREIAKHRGDPARITLMGHSAGAHIAAMLAYNPRFLAAVGLSRGDVHGFVGLAGPYDFVPTEPKIVDNLGAEGGAARAMPATFVQGGEPPSLLVTGDEDKRVEPGNTQRLAAALRRVGSPVEVMVVPGYGHPSTLVRLAAPLRSDAYLDKLAAFAAR